MIYGNYLFEYAKSEPEFFVTDKIIDGIPVKVYYEDKNEDTLLNLDRDFTVMLKNYKKHLKEDFIPWLKGSNKQISDSKILSQLVLTQVQYFYHNYADKYSPSGKSGKFGSFEFTYEAKNNSELSEELLSQPAAMEIMVYDNKTIKKSCYDI